MRRLLCLLAALIVAAPATAREYAQRAEVRDFVREVAERHAFSERDLLALFSRVRRLEPVLQAIQPQPERARSWDEYRAIFVNERRIQGGLEFWDAHRGPLLRAREEFGVPEEIIAAIVGIETFYGRNTGKWRVIDALATLAFDHPPRAAYFRSELENFLVLARGAGLDVFSVRGSYAGAIGIPQFMPGSVLRYAVDFDRDGAIDLRVSAEDAIGSVANFLKAHGWRPDSPVLIAARVTGSAWREYADGTVLPRHLYGALREAGVEPLGAPPVEDEARAVLIELPTPERPSEFRIGFHNFYVITRYNRSAFYASVVAELAAALRAARR